MAAPWVAEAPAALTEVEAYDWSVGGYVIVRGALSAAACHDGGALASLHEHPELVRCLAHVLPPGGTGPGEEGHKLDEPFALLTADDAGPALQGGAGGPLGLRDPPHAIANVGPTRGAHAVNVFWALDDVPVGAGGVVVVPASHVLTAEAPEALLSGQQDLGVVRQPGECVDPITEGHPAPTTTLNAGDLLILHANLLHGVRPWNPDVLAGRTAPRLARARFVEKMGASSAQAFAEARETEEDEAQTPEWLSELSDAERALLRLGDEDPARLRSDGERVWLAEEPGRHPSLYQPDPETLIDPVE